MVKHYIHSDQLSQPPMLVIPQAHMEKIDTVAPSLALGRNNLSERQCKEFRKTAKSIEGHPWGLRTASTYLQDLVANNQNKSWPGPEALSFLTEGPRDIPRMMPDEFIEWYDFAPKSPKVVTVRARGSAPPKAKGTAKAKAKSKGKAKAKSKAQGKAKAKATPKAGPGGKGSGASAAPGGRRGSAAPCEGGLTGEQFQNSPSLRGKPGLTSQLQGKQVEGRRKLAEVKSVGGSRQKLAEAWQKPAEAEKCHPRVVNLFVHRVFEILQV